MNIISKITSVALAFFWFACGTEKSQHEVVSQRSLLNEMSDPAALTLFSTPAYKLMQASSYDPAEKSKKDSAGWFGNKDYDNYIRVEKNRVDSEYVIMDADGPGAITRWWIPLEQTLQDRTLRIYIDNDSVPVIEENYHDFMNGRSGIKWPFAFIASDEKDSVNQLGLPPGMKQMSADMYMPIPFAHKCKVTLTGRVFYYIIDYRLYPQGTEVVSFNRNTLKENSSLIDSVSKKLLSDKPFKTNSLKKTRKLSAGEAIEMDLPEGEHAVTGIRLKINSVNNIQMNRAAVLQMAFDGTETVWSPVAEFFGGGVYAGPVRNRNISVAPDGTMISNYVMPYQKNGRIYLKNYGKEPVEAELSVSVDDYAWSAGSMYFHATWHEEAPLSSPPFKDWNYIEIKGKGRYAGDVLTVYSVPKIWWGEGDEKIYIDQDTFPNHLGTGLEDYYGYAWGMSNYFNSPFISMPSRDARGKDDWSGYNTMARMRLLDDILFNTFLKVDIEAWIMQAGVSYSVCTFWYGMPGAAANIANDESAVVRPLPGHFHNP